MRVFRDLFIRTLIDCYAVAAQFSHDHVFQLVFLLKTDHGNLMRAVQNVRVRPRAEMVRLRKVLEKTAPGLVPESRPYRLPVDIETDAQQVLSLLDRGAHRVALAAYRGDVLPDSTAPGVAELRDTVRTALRQALLAEASVDVLLAFAETDAGAEDDELLRLCLKMLPARSPKRAALVSRIERLEASA